MERTGKDPSAYIELLPAERREEMSRLDALISARMEGHSRALWAGTFWGGTEQTIRVLFLIGPLNLRSRRAVEKIGGVAVGSRVDAGGRESIVYQITPTAARPALLWSPSNIRSDFPS